MAEAVRFYWLRGDAALPLSAIPDRDRNPLRVRRSVVQSHAPEVVRQLEAGRFVAAAWPSARSILLILCHPNLAKGAFDTLLVDTSAVPQVVLQVREWDDVPQRARLFLAAYGSEATNAEEGVTARHRLVDWLESHDQAGMAATVRRLLQIPARVPVRCGRGHQQLAERPDPGAKGEARLLRGRDGEAIRGAWLVAGHEA